MNMTTRTPSAAPGTIRRRLAALLGASFLATRRLAPILGASLVCASVATPAWAKMVTIGQISSGTSLGNGKVYFFFAKGFYASYDVKADKIDAGYPKALDDKWPSIPQGTEITAALQYNGKAYFFSRDKQYWRLDIASDTIDPGYPQPIKGHWGNLWNDRVIQGAINWNGTQAFFFSGAEYVRYDLTKDAVDPGYPLKTTTHWKGLTIPSGERITAVVDGFGNGKAYFFFSDGTYSRFDAPSDKVDGTQAISAGWKLPGPTTTARLSTTPTIPSGANSECMLALNCLIDGLQDVALNDFCTTYMCDDGKNALSNLIAGINTEDNLRVCAASVQMSIELGLVAVLGVMDAAGKEAMNNSICGNAAVQQRMQQSGGSVCEPRTRMNDWLVKVCSAESYARDAGVPMTCGADEEMIGWLCYPRCPAGLRNSASDSSFCRGDCPNGYTDTGLLCSEPLKTAEMVKQDCPAGWTTYPLTCTDWLHLPVKTIPRNRCPAGYTDVAGVCGKGGGTIAKPNRARPTGVPVHACATNREADGALCYQPCSTGFKGVADRCWKK